MQPDDLLTVDQALEYLSTSKGTLYRLLREFGVQRYAKPTDTRRKYLRRADLDALTTPRPVATEYPK